MHIIPDTIPPDQRELAQALAAGTYDSVDQAAIAVLLRVPGLLDRADVFRHVVLAEIEGDADQFHQAASVMWPSLAAAVAAGHIPMLPGELAGVRVAALLAGVLGDALDALDEPMRRAAVEAVAHAARIPLSGPDDADVERPEGDGSEPVPDYVGTVPLTRCMRCGRSYHPCPCELRCGECDEPVDLDPPVLRHTARHPHDHDATLEVTR